MFLLSSIFSAFLTRREPRIGNPGRGEFLGAMKDDLVNISVEIGNHGSPDHLEHVTRSFEGSFALPPHSEVVSPGLATEAE